MKPVKYRSFDTCFGAVNEPHEYWCWNCMDYGIIEICDPSTDALIGWTKCDCKSYPLWLQSAFSVKFESAGKFIPDWYDCPPF
jgi:hypothetical protein